MVLGRIRRSMREEGPGARVCFFRVQAWKGWFSEFKGSARVLEWGPDSDLFVGRSAGVPRRVPNEENAAWLVMSMAKNAQGGIFYDGRVANR